jgi:hypothetical protein
MLVLLVKYMVGGFERDVIVVLRGKYKTRFSIVPHVLDQIQVA